MACHDVVADCEDLPKASSWPGTSTLWRRRFVISASLVTVSGE